MLVFRIIATVFMGLSCLEVIDNHSNDAVVLFGLSWRAFVIVALWLI